ncbi:MAG TPA: ATP-grasp domain-containing protein [Patescibacteria group bacterium]|nr:ATP-grasp domain-containing protein [Patescibacteria group bacterium]
MGGSTRLLLLLPTRTYRTEDFVDAAHTLGVDLVCASEKPSTLEALAPDSLLTLDFTEPAGAATAVAEWSAERPLAAVVGVDDVTAAAAAAIAERLGLRASAPAAVAAARDKFQMRQCLAAAGVPVPRFRRITLGENPVLAARGVAFPCVLKPLSLSASRGVIRANTTEQFVVAFKRIAALLARDDVTVSGDAARYLLAEEYVPGLEVALEGLLIGGTLHVLALFDKPDPLEGPFFEETIYVTPSRLPDAVQGAIRATTAAACAGLGLTEGPVHAELRVNDDGPWVLEVAARSIGGLCSRALRFGTGMTLEEIILRHALGWPIATLERERPAAGVMMIPIPRAGVLKDVRGLDDAKATPHVEDVVISAHLGQEVVPLPEAWQYLGFIFARGEAPADVEDALRIAHSRLRFAID